MLVLSDSKLDKSGEVNPWELIIGTIVRYDPYCNKLKVLVGEGWARGGGGVPEHDWFWFFANISKYMSRIEKLLDTNLKLANFPTK